MKRVALFCAVLSCVSLFSWARPPQRRVPHPDVTAVDRAIKGRLSAQEQKKHFRFPEGFALDLVAAEPLVINPVTMTVDDQGRIYVSESHTYRYGPGGSPIKPFRNPVVRLDPRPGGKGYQRVLVADGFDDPVMGIAVKGRKLWLTANNYLYCYDLGPAGKAVNRKTILVDRNKAWNPFGMFVLEWGPDGLLYLSVGNHAIDIRGPGGRMTGRRQTGLIMRMNPDGTKMERLVQGLRVPYSFEFDPFGQLWLLSNGEGNPNRFVRVIEGVDYHCFSRPGVDNDWLAGNHPLAPPCFELPRGANTQIIRYYGAAFPASYQGSLLLDNWGAHGFAGANRAIHRYVPDARGRIVAKEALLSCTDPHFRPSHIDLDLDGNLLVADWYGRDDESDLTGRIWRLRYAGKDTPAVKHRLTDRDWSDAVAVTALGSPHHRVRQRGLDQLLRGKPARVVQLLKQHAAKAPEALGAANSLWALARIGTAEARKALAAGADHPDARVRRLAVSLLRRYQAPGVVAVARRLRKDDDPAVRVAAALALDRADAIRAALVDALRHGAAKDEHLRYEAAWHLAKHGDAASLDALVSSNDGDLRLAGLIAIDVACYEQPGSKPVALTVLSRAMGRPGQADVDHLLTLARFHADAALRPALEKLLARKDLPGGTVASAIMVLKTRNQLSPALQAKYGKQLIESVEKGAVRLGKPADYLAVFEFLEAAGPSEFGLRLVGGQMRSRHPAVREAAHGLARRFGVKSAPLAGQLWRTALAPKGRSEDAVEALATLARIESKPNQQAWQKVLANSSPALRTEGLRWWRNFKGNQDMTSALLRQVPELLKADPALKDDLAAVLRQLEVAPERVEALKLPAAVTDREALTRQTLAALAAVGSGQRRQRALLGRQVFDRAGCTRCHTTATQTTPLAPSLKGIATQKAEYLVESVLYPSKVIKTGFETERVATTRGKVVSGLVKEEGNFVRVLNLDQDVRIAKKDIEERKVQRISIMPEGLEKQMSRSELLDLVIYLTTLR
jgi:putative membrane-bound dehydrogenase-like protein